MLKEINEKFVDFSKAEAIETGGHEKTGFYIRASFKEHGYFSDYIYKTKEEALKEIRDDLSKTKKDKNAN